MGILGSMRTFLPVPRSLGGFAQLEISLYNVGSFFGGSQRNFDYSAIAIHQHFHIVAESIGLGVDKIRR